MVSVPTETRSSSIVQTVYCVPLQYMYSTTQVTRTIKKWMLEKRERETLKNVQYSSIRTSTVQY